MSNDKENKKNIFSRRIFLLGTGKFLILLILIGRLFYLQLLQYFNYHKLSDKNRIRVSRSIPLRGHILDRKAKILANNRKIYNLIYEKSSKLNYHDTLHHLAALLEDEGLESTAIRKIKKSRGTRVEIASNIKWEQIIQIEENITELPGINVEYGYERVYNYAKEFSHVIGYVASPGSFDTNLEYFNSEIKIGKSGVEKTKQQILAGVPGIKKYEVDARGIVRRELAVHDSYPGESVNLTLDLDLQKLAAELLADTAGCANLIDVNTGEVLVMYSSPTFDPNMFIKGVSEKEWQKMISGETASLMNKNISATYPPGSIFKLVVGLAALERGVDPARKVFCQGYYELGNRRFHCWKKTGHGHVNFLEAVARSCNCYFFETSKLIGINVIAETAKILGLGQKTLVELAQEVEGTVPNSEWLLKRYKTNWRLGDTLNASIGQGYVLSTPLQLALLNARIASGKNIKPTIFLNNISPVIEEIKIDKKNLAILREAMFNVINVEGGTGFSNKLKDSGVDICGKTSTAQVISKKNADQNLSLKSVDYKYRNHGFFAGFGPHQNPKFASCVVTEHEGYPRKAYKIAHNLISAASKMYTKSPL